MGPLRFETLSSHSHTSEYIVFPRILFHSLPFQLNNLPRQQTAKCKFDVLGIANHTRVFHTQLPLRISLNEPRLHQGC